LLLNGRRQKINWLISPGESIRESGSAGKEAPLITPLHL